jgi:hypothetical protein
VPRCFANNDHKYMKSGRLLALTLALAGTTATGAQVAPDTLHSLQSLGNEVRTTLDHAKVGKPPESKSLSAMEHALMRLRDAAAGNAQLQHKYQAIGLLFGNLKHHAVHPAQTPLNPDNKTRAQIDVEVVTDQHGASCAAALGIGENLPVQLMLGQAGSARSDAWFRFEPRPNAYARFTTESAGPDPALEVFSGCGSAAEKIASNDDAIGLDAALSVGPANHQPVFVHLTNSGQGGRIQVHVANATSTVAGSVKEVGTGSAVAGAQITLFDTSGNNTGYFAYSDNAGSYSVPVDVSGDYYVRVEGSYSGGSYLPELYPAGPCWSGSYGIFDCDLAHAQAISVASGVAISGINLYLLKGQKIVGQARDNLNQPLGNAYLQLFDSNDYPRMAASTDGFGRYSFTAVPPGSYKLVATAAGYGSQMFNHLACGGVLQVDCDLALAGVLTISNQDINGVDFSLPVLASIQGTVVGVNSQLVDAQISVVNTDGNTVATGWTDTAGHYVAGPLALGNYRVLAQAGGYFGQVFDGIDCATLDCSAEISGATQIALTTDGQHAQADFQLSALPSVSGHVQDASSGLPLANVSVAAWSVPGGLSWPSSSTVTDSNGDYVLANTLPGQYYLWAQSDDHVDQLYSAVDCEAFQGNFSIFTLSCDFGSATPFTVALGQALGNFDFALDASSGFTGRALIRAEPGFDLPAQASYAYAYDSNGIQAARAAMDALGNYVIFDLPPGTYTAAAQGAAWWQAQYLPQMWQSIDCPSGCDPFAGTPIPLAAGAATSDIDFDLVQLDAVVGRVTNTQGDPVSGAVIDLFDSLAGFYTNSAITDSQGYYVVQGYAGSVYFVGTEAGAGYFDQVYAGITCPLGAAYYGLCPFANATEVPLDSSSTAPRVVDFVLQSNDPIFANGFQ